MIITIKRQSNDGLEIRLWNFCYHFYHHELILSSYVIERRKTKRHKFREIDRWYRGERWATIAKPRVSAKIRAEARDQFLKGFVITLKVKS